MALELSEKFQHIIDHVADEYSDKVIEVYQSSGDTFVRIEAEAVTDICRYLKNEHGFIYLADIFGADRFTSQERFEVYYNLFCLKHQLRLFVKTRLPEEEPVIDTVTDIWKSANWHEREVYDMFGVRFNGHPDLRRIYMPQDFEYYPLRKEFPLLGIPGSIELPSSTPDTE